MKHTIVNPTIHTPSMAHYAVLSEKTENVCTVEYYTKGNQHIQLAPATARLMYENAWEKLVGIKLNANEIADEPRRKDQKQRTEQEFGRDKTETDKVSGLDADWPIIDFNQVNGPANAVTSQAPVPKGKHKGEGDLTEDVSSDAMYTWESIEEAMFNAGCSNEQIKAAKISLFESDGPGRRPIVQESSFSEAQEDEPAMDGYTVDDDIAAVDDTLGPPELSAEVEVGMSVPDLRNNLVNLSDAELDALDDLPRGQRIKHVRMADGKVVKIIPATVESTFEENGYLYAKVDVAGEQEKIKLREVGGKTLVKRGDKSGILYRVTQISSPVTDGV